MQVPRPICIDDGCQKIVHVSHNLIEHNAFHRIENHVEIGEKVTNVLVRQFRPRITPNNINTAAIGPTDAKRVGSFLFSGVWALATAGSVVTVSL